MRLWESMANKTCCFAQRTDILFPDKPLDGYHYVEYSSPEEFYERAKHFLDNKETCIQIGKNAYEFVKQKHVGRARVEYIFSVMLNGLNKTLLGHKNIIEEKNDC